MLRKVPLVTGETYHIYNRGAHKQELFTSESDFQRFLFLLYFSNSKTPFVMRDLFSKYRGESSVKLFSEEIETKLVDVLAYSLMPNHFHLILRQREKDGIALFMRRLATAYSMYFNTKYEHSGTLFQGPFKSSHIGSESYFRYIFSYVHLNPLDVFQPGWKTVGLKNKNEARKFINSYRFSSFIDYATTEVRPAGAIVAKEAAPDFITEQNDFAILLQWLDTEESPLYEEAKMDKNKYISA